jgi:hypothetical protein
MKNEFVNQHPHTMGLNLYTLYKYILGDKTNKYLPFITKEIQRKSQKVFEDDYNMQEEWTNLIESVDLKGSVLSVVPEKNRLVAYHLLQNLTSYVDIKMILLFEELCESNYIQGVDISNITSSKELEELINYGMTKKILNQERKLIETVFENNEWFAIRPLTYESSKKYGAGTKWCTSSEQYPGHFYRYNRNGIIVYLFNKTNHLKYGIHFSNFQDESPLSIYDAADNRVDSSLAGIPLETMQSIFKEVGYSIGGLVDTSEDYIKKVYPEIWEEYWVPYYKSNEKGIQLDEVQVNGVDITDPAEEGEAEVYQLVPDPELSLVNHNEEWFKNMLDAFNERIKPKTIFHKWYQKIVFGGHKKLIFLGVPVSYQGMIAVERTKQYFEKSFDNTNFQLIFYPVHTGNDLVITKI